MQMFIIFVYTILLILFSFASYCKYNRFLNIISVFTVIWCVFGSISALGLYGLRPPKLFIHLLAWVFISIVDVFSLLCVHKESCYRDFKIVKYPKRIALLQLISIILLLPTVLSSIQVLISTGSITQVRSEYFSVDSGYSNIFFSLLFGAIPKGMLGALIVYYIYVSWFCHTSTCVSHRCTRVSHPEPPSHLPPHTIPLGHPSAFFAPSKAYGNCICVFVKKCNKK